MKSGIRCIVFAIVAFFVCETLRAQEHAVSNDSLEEGEVHVITSPDDEAFVAAFYHHSDGSFIRPGYAFSSDGGETWRRGVFDFYGFDPVGAISGTEIFYTFVEAARAQHVLTVGRTSDFGTSWALTRIDSSLPDKPWIVVDHSDNPLTRGTCYLMWDRQIDSKIFFTRATPPLYEFSEPVIIDSAYGEVLLGANIAITPEGVVLATYGRFNLATRTVSLYVSYSIDGGVSFSLPWLYGISPVVYPLPRKGRDIEILQLPSIATNGIQAYVAVIEPIFLSEATYFAVALYVFDVFESDTSRVSKEFVANDSTRCSFFPSIAMYEDRVFVQYTSGRDSAGCLYDLQQHAAERYGVESYMYHELLGERQNTNAAITAYNDHHYNQIAVSSSGDKLFSVYTDYRNTSNDIYCSITPLHPVFAAEHGEFLPKTPRLSQNHPNPFNPETRIAFTLPRESFVTLRVFDILGREIATLAHEMREPGEHAVTFDATRFPSGTYFYRLETSEGYIATRKMLLLK